MWRIISFNYFLFEHARIEVKDANDYLEIMFCFFVARTKISTNKNKQ